MYGLKDKHIKAINSVFSQYPQIGKTILYGSRAKGNYRNGSDIDLTLVGKTLDLTTLFKIETQLDDLLLPYKMDLSILRKIENQDLVDHIKRVGITFYEKMASEWKEDKLGNVLEIKYGKDHKKLPDGEIPCYGSGGIMRFVNEQLYNKESILIPRKGSLNNIYYINEPFWTVDTLFWSKINTEIVFPKFLFYQLTEIDFTRLNVGSAVPSLTVQVLNELKINLPEPTEQKQIAEILTSLDDKIDLLHRQNNTLEAMTETLFREWFVESAEKNWEEKPLSSIASFLNGLACQKFPPKNEIDKLPVLKIKQLRNGFSSDCDWCTTDVKPQYIVHNGDVIFSWSASLMVKIWDGETAILNQHLFKVTSDEFPKWYYYLWSKHHLEEFISISASHATTMGHIKRGDLDNAKVLVPDDDKMIEFTEIQEPIIEKIITNNKQLSKLVELRETLLPQLMSGEVKVVANE
ncbi:MAG: restriction endonuclease subunit S [Flavobacteriaceae bacterium]